MKTLLAGCCLLLTLAHGKEKNRITFPQHDGVKRLEEIQSRRQFNHAIKTHNIVITLFSVPRVLHDPASVNSWNVHDIMLEMTAQVFSMNDVKIRYVDMLKLPDLAAREGATRDGAIHVYHESRKLVFYGHRSPEVLLGFILKIKNDPVTVIDNKSEKKVFDQLDTVKLVAYFDSIKDQGYKHYYEAAKIYQPNVPFYAVFDQKIARQLKLKTVGNIQLYKPYESQTKALSQRMSSREAIVEFVEKNRRTILRRITLEDVHSTWINQPLAHLIMSFVNPSTDKGAAFFTLLKKIARQNIDRDDISIVWIDPEPFPTIAEYWSHTYGVDVSKPSIGLVNITDNRSTWFPVQSLENESESSKLRVLQQWFDNIARGKVTIPHKPIHNQDSTNMNEINFDKVKLKESLERQSASAESPRGRDEL